MLNYMSTDAFLAIIQSLKLEYNNWKLMINDKLKEWYGIEHFNYYRLNIGNMHSLHTHFLSCQND